MPAEPMNRWAEETCTSSYVGRYDYHPKESPMTDFHVMVMTFAV
jgi:hypothetical protein